MYRNGLEKFYFLYWEKAYVLIWWAAVAIFCVLCTVLPGMLYFSYTELAGATLLNGLALIFTLGGLSGLMLLIHYIIEEVL